MSGQKAVWTKDDQGRDQWLAGRGRLYLYETTGKGTPFVSSFGAVSVDSFSGFVPAEQDRERIKEMALRSAARWWLGGPMDRVARRLLPEGA